MQVKELRAALSEIREVFSAAGTKLPERDLNELIGLLDGHDEQELDSFLEALAQDLSTHSNTAKKNSTSAPNEVLVSRYMQRLQAADIDRKLFDEVFADLKSDAGMRKAEVELLAKKYLARKEPSKAKQLEAIETRFREFRYDRKANERAGAVSPW